MGVTCKKYFSWAGTHILQAELKLLLVREEILRELNCQVVVSKEAVEKSQHLHRRERTQTKLLFYTSNQSKDRQETEFQKLHTLIYFFPYSFGVMQVLV